MGRRGSHLLSTGAPTLQSLDGEKGVSPTVLSTGVPTLQSLEGEEGVSPTFDRGANFKSLDGEKGFVSLVVVGAQKGGIISGEARDFLRRRWRMQR